MKDNYYFDNAATTWPKPEVVYQFMDSFFRSHGVNPGRSGHSLAVEAEQMIFSTRKMLAQFFGFDGDPNRVVFTQNATDSLNIALSGLLKPGDHLITSGLEHNAVQRPVNHLQRDGGVKVTTVPADAHGMVPLSKIESAITADTRAIVLNHASNVIGVVQNLSGIAEIAGRHNVLLVVDTAQTAGVLDINMADGIDVLTFTGHKGLFGPMGIGGLIVAGHVELAANKFGGTGVDSISDFHPDAYPHRLEAGTVSIPGIAGLHAAQKWFAELGTTRSQTETPDHAKLCSAARQHIHKKEMTHCDRIYNQLTQVPSLQFIAPREAELKYVATMSFNLKGTPAMQLAEMLDADYHICVRAGLHCAPSVHNAFGTTQAGGAVRISPGYFTDESEVTHLINAIESLAQ